MKVAFCLILLIFSILVFGVRINKTITLDQNCTGYLKRAADANSVSMALVELSRAIQYLERENLTSGYTSVFWKTPDEDIAFWYNNLKESQHGLEALPKTASQLEQTNVLMKLRETLLDNGKNGESLTCPNGLSVYPNNGLWCLLIWLALFALGGIVGIIMFYQDEY